MASQVGSIAQLLDATLDPSTHKKAEQALKIEQGKPQYSLSLLNIVASEPLPLKTRLAAALAFKNFIRSNWVDADGNYKLPGDEVQTIKSQLIGLMISCPPTIQTQLGDAISIIADSDFWERWQTLTQELVERFSPVDPKVNIGVLEVAHSIFVRWRPLFRTDELYTEINHVISTFAQPFVQLLVQTDEQITKNTQNKDLLHKYLTYTNPILETDDDSEVSVIDTVKADICEALELYTLKYDEDFGKYTEPFITNAWNLLSSTGAETKYDLLVSKALHFLTAVAGTSQHSGVFADENVLGQVVEKVILPNVALRESDLELFEDEPIEYIRRDLEGSDTDSRRRSATDFLRRLQEKYEQLVTGVVYKYINHYLEQGKSDWKAKDTAVYLFISIAAKGSVTATQGVKTVNSLVNVVDFFEQHIASDLMASGGVEPISKVDAIKYLHTFRSQLTKEQWKLAFPPLIQNLASDNYVVYSYAAIAVERLLFLTDDSGKAMFPREDIQPFAKDLLDHLFKLIEKERTPAKLQENEFLMRCVMRILIVLKEGAAHLVEGVLTHLVAITNMIKQNPSNPRFYYYHFEALGALIRYCSSTHASLFNQRLWEPFNQILVEDVTEFLQYIFQILAQLLESSPADAISENYKAFLSPLLEPALWDTKGNVPACTRLLSSIIPATSVYIVSDNKLEQILGIFQRLLAVKKYQFGVVDQYFGTILSLIFTKLQGNPPDSLKLRFARFFHLVSARVEAGYGADYFMKHSEKIQEGIFAKVYPPFVLAETEKLARPVDRKLAVVSLTKTLCDSQAFAQKFAKGWANTCRILLALLVNPPVVSAGLGDELIAEADVDDIGFGLSYTALNTCKPIARDDYPEVTAVAPWVSAYISSANQRHNGAIVNFVNTRLTPEQQQALQQYLQ
ncbi:cse1 [Colletotrichum higginsianum]|nr:cse1 [Colletotrichum higginsianum]